MATDEAGILVRKESGDSEPYDEKKVAGALRRAGLSEKSIRDALDGLRPKLHSGITTREIYGILFRIIDKERPDSLHRFNLKRALTDLGPAGYEFEDFIAKLLSLEGYKTDVRQILEGKCVSHEIDVIAEGHDQAYMCECKFHNSGGIKCRIQTALYTYARFLDLVEGAKLGRCRKFSRPWLICNTKFSTDVEDYAACMGFPLLGWHHPYDRGLERMVEERECWPVSVIPMHRTVLEKLLAKKIVTVIDIPERPEKLVEITGISLPVAKQITERAEYAR
jgi:hypothetical protein